MKQDTYRGRIREVASEMFRRRGFRNVSMDDLSKALGVSKKTIYKFYSSKAELVSDLVTEHMEKQKEAILAIVQNAKDPVFEMVEIGRLLNRHYADMPTGVIEELKKYFFDIWQEVQSIRNEFVLRGVTVNLRNGIKLGVYRDDIDPEFIARTYLNSVVHACDEGTPVNPERQFSMVLEYHMYGVLTAKGRRLFEHYKKKLTP